MLTLTTIQRWFRFAFSPTFWIGAVQTAWTVTLVCWIVFFVDRRSSHPNEGWWPLVIGIALLVALLGGAIIVVIHFSRQVAHNRAMKDFVSAVSHDLRTPLATAKLHVETLRLHQLNPEQRESCLSMALWELDRLESGIEGVLTASRIERRGLKFEAERMEIGRFLDEYALIKAREVALHGASLSWLGESTRSLAIWSNDSLLRQMLDNLVDNAVNHCPTGVNIKLELSEEGRNAVISVADNGPGLERREFRRIFRMFYRARPARRHTKGTGLGLFIVAGIAQAHSGRAWVESAGVNKGCSFKVALPLAHS